MPTACCMSALSDLQLLGFPAIASGVTFFPHSLLTAVIGVSGYVRRHITFQVDSILDDTPRLLVEGG
jgi:hypothetical protein